MISLSFKLDVLELLVHAGADLNAKNKHDETPADICEDSELKERILQLRTEQETKRQAEAQKRRVKRSQSNTRAQSVRRTSLREKGLTARRDAVEEAKLRMQAESKVCKLDLIINESSCTSLQDLDNRLHAFGWFFYKENFALTLHENFKTITILLVA